MTRKREFRWWDAGDLLRSWRWSVSASALRLALVGGSALSWAGMKTEEIESDSRD